MFHASEKCESSAAKTPSKRPKAPRTPSKSPKAPRTLSSLSENGPHPSPSASARKGGKGRRRVNYGSEASSDESDEEELTPQFLPRVFMSITDTPIDDDDLEQPITSDPMHGDGTSPIACESEDSDFLMTTEQPWSFYDFQWREFPDPPIPLELRREKFTQKNVGPVTPCVDPYEIFVAIWDRKFMEYIASETNKYAQQLANQMIENHELHPSSRISQWHDTTADELYLYFGLTIAMGVVIKSRLVEYWNSTCDILHTPGFSAQMSVNRFLLLQKCLHFNDNANISALELDTYEAKLYKIQPVLSHLNMKFQNMYNLSQNISMDQSLLQWNGWLNNDQLIPNKAAGFGIKSYEVCESETGYLWRFEIHTPHKCPPPQQLEDPLNASTPAIVLRLTHGLENKGHTVWMDNFFNSPCLARRLKSLGFDCVGTLRTNRKFVPQDLNNLTSEEMRRDQITGLTSGDIDVMVWSNKSRVAMISTYHGNATSEVRGTMKPILILDYNTMMGGVDNKDLMLAAYPERKRTSVWYKKLFMRLLSVSVLNAYIIHRQSSSSSLSHRNFRMAVANSLISKFGRRQSTDVIASSPSNLHLELTHRLAEYPFKQHQRQRLRRKCRVCKRLAATFCFGCKIPVCIDTCFLTLHLNMK